MRISAARTAGLLYLIVVITGVFSLAYVPSRIAVPGDTAAMIANIRAQEPLFRAGVAAGIACYLAFLLLPLPLYRLLAPAGPVAAKLMVLLAVVSVPMALLNIARRLDILAAIEGGAPVGDVGALMLAYSNGMQMVQLFWGLWLLPLGWLVVRTRAIPRLLGVLLMLGCLGYLIKVFGFVLAPEVLAEPWMRFVSLPGSVGEIATALWLAILGARPVATAERTAEV